MQSLRKRSPVSPLCRGRTGSGGDGRGCEPHVQLKLRWGGTIDRERGARVPAGARQNKSAAWCSQLRVDFVSPSLARPRWSAACIEKDTDWRDGRVRIGLGRRGGHLAVLVGAAQLERRPGQVALRQRVSRRRRGQINVPPAHTLATSRYNKYTRHRR